ncbi:hypothetical protein Q2403_25085, partial [Escherichia coli]|nr:hypothetical protein [Escherichia coli]
PNIGGNLRNVWGEKIILVGCLLLTQEKKKKEMGILVGVFFNSINILLLLGGVFSVFFIYHQHQEYKMMGGGLY